jgi:peptidoglycan/LPS O-acetylase OafA/YrhL
MSAVANLPQALHKPTQAKSKYRPEIDGLRAFAVVAVIINHFNKDLLPSGYLGVDIFFVISGYVITSSLAGRESKNFVDFLTGFYERRIKRLVPALVVFVLITSVLICFFNSDPDLALKTGTTSLFGLSNLFLQKQSTDYFAQSTELNPFTHTWSLGVEEQFYLLFPFLIWFSGFGQQTAKGARNIFFWVGALTIASLIGFIYLYQVNQPAAYFLMPTRFWEMASGCLIFIGFQKRARVEQALEQVPPLLVLVAMVAVMFLPISAAVPATISVVVFSAILIACLKQGTAAYKFFTLEKVVFVGLISYSLYLWHWTVLSISRWTIDIHWWSVPIQIGLIIGLSVLSYKCIETPFRKNQFSLKRLLLLIFSALALVAAAVFTLGLKAMAKRNLLYLGTPVENPLNQCQKNVSSTIVVGDSHGGEFSKVVNLALNGECNTLIGKDYTGNSFLFNHRVVGTQAGKSTREVRLLDAKKFIEKAQGNAAIQLLVINPYWIGFFSPPEMHLKSYDWVVRHHYDQRGNPVRWDKALFLYLQNIKIVAQSIPGIRVAIVAPEPEFNWVNDGGAPNGACAKEWFSLGKYPAAYNEVCEQYERPGVFSRWHTEQRRAFISAALTELAREQKNVFIFDPLPVLCPPLGKFCSTHGAKNIRLFRDDDHISENGARTLAPAFKEFAVNLLR